MTQQKKDWLKRFIDMGEAADYVIDFLLEVNTKDVPNMSNEDYGAYVRAMAELKRQVRERKREMKMHSR